MNALKSHWLQILLTASLIASGIAVLTYGPVRASLAARVLLASRTVGSVDFASGPGMDNAVERALIPPPASAPVAVALITLVPGSPPESVLKAGRAAFAANCAACHLATGVGSPGLIPPLADSDSFVRLSPDEITRNILMGRSGPIVVNGAPYNNVMPPMTYLPDNTIANIVTYVLNKWGDAEGRVTGEHVARVRSKGLTGEAADTPLKGYK